MSFQEGVEKRRKHLEYLLEKLFANHAGRHHLEFKPLLFINARDRDDPEILTIRQRLMECSKTHPRWGEEMPTSWIPLEIQISELVEQGQNIISRDQVLDLNKQNGTMVLEERHIDTFLKVSHSLGKILYFDEGRMHDFILINPVFLIDVLRSIVTEETFWPEKKKLRAILRKVQETGTMSKKEILELWQQEHCAHFVEYTSYLLDIMVHLDVLVAKRSILDDQAGQPELPSDFFVPCMLQRKNHTDYMKTKCQPDTSIIMAYNFTGELIPPALLFRFIAAFINMYSLKVYREIRMLFKDLVVVEIDKDHDVAVQMSQNRLVVLLIHSKSVTDISPSLASSIQECLTAAITRISKFYSRLSDPDKEHIDINNYIIDFGVVCKSFLRKDMCFFNQKYLPTTGNYAWVCPHGKQHNVRPVCIWFAEKVLNILLKKYIIYT